MHRNNYRLNVYHKHHCLQYRILSIYYKAHIADVCATQDKTVANDMK